MKSLIQLIFLSVSILVVSCGGNSTKRNTPENQDKVEPVSTKTSKEAFDEYETFLSDLKKQPWKLEHSTLAMEKFKEVFEEFAPETCDTAMVMFLEFYEESEEDVYNYVAEDKTLQDRPMYQEQPVHGEYIMTSYHKKVDRKLKEHGYRLENFEGFADGVLDRAFIAKNFYKLVSPEMKRFLERLQHDADQPFSVDAGISISEKEFVNRLMWWDQFIKDQPTFLMIDRAKEIKKQLFTFFLIGMDNTPCENVLEVEEGEVIASEVNPYFVTMYEMVIKKYPKSQVTALVKPYFEAKKRGDGKESNRLIEKYTEQGFMIDFSEDYEYCL